ncbi:hypothetical protein N7526_007706 [Penicillium atrosanguineum]|nr:hypothetical protein N7526_007706 [Penicillium atrosanguineum]
MDQTHTRALEALQPFIHLANSNSATSPRFIANIITNATSSPQTYVFAELLETPNIQTLSSPDTPAEHRGYLKLLEIFAWATPNLPKLSIEQTLKLRLLSLLSLSATVKPLTYQSLMTALSLSSTAELESLVTTAIYASLISARLSPATTPPTVNVTSVAPLRDVRPQSLPKMENAEKRHAKEREYQIQLEDATKQRQEAFDVSNAGARSRPGAWGRRGGPRLGTGMGNKREADDIDHDDGYFEAGDGESGSRMDIDEGSGSRGSRHSKRVVGRKA